jgi:hypothetical protein
MGAVRASGTPQAGVIGAGWAVPSGGPHVAGEAAGCR